MNSLREEIEEQLIYFPINQTGDYESISNNIIKLIEKRIDSTIEDIKHDIEFQSKHEIYNKPDLSIALHHLYEFKEMLSK